MFSDCFEEVPYDGPNVEFDNPFTTSKTKVKDISVRNAKSCQLICQKETACKYFTWVSSSTQALAASQHKCYLKSGKTGAADLEGGTTKWLANNKNTAYNKVISGPKFCIARK